MQAAIRQAYLSTNDELGARLDKAQEAGACAVTALVRRVAGRTYLFCANAGDCRAVLFTQSAGGDQRCGTAFRSCARGVAFSSSRRQAAVSLGAARCDAGVRCVRR